MILEVDESDEEDSFEYIKEERRYVKLEKYEKRMVDLQSKMDLQTQQTKSKIGQSLMQMTNFVQRASLLQKKSMPLEKQNT